MKGSVETAERLQTLVGELVLDGVVDDLAPVGRPGGKCAMCGGDLGQEADGSICWQGLEFDVLLCLDCGEIHRAS